LIVSSVLIMVCVTMSAGLSRHDAAVVAAAVPRAARAPAQDQRLPRLAPLPGAASVASLLAAVVTEIYLCNVCSCHEILRRNGLGQAAEQQPGVVTWRFDGPIVFANRDFFKMRLLEVVAQHQQEPPGGYGDGWEHEQSREVTGGGLKQMETDPLMPDGLAELFLTLPSAMRFAKRRGEQRRVACSDLHASAMPAVHTVILKFSSVSLKRLLAESPWVQFISERQRFWPPPRLDN
jgi:hypothetical protein